MLKTFKVNLTTAHFPTLVSKASRSVALPDPADGVNTLTSTYVGRMAGTTMNTPAPIAMENVVPTIEGLASFGYTNAPGIGANLVESKGYLFSVTNDKATVKPIPTLTSPTTVATVQGMKFAYNSTIGLWRLDLGVSEPMIGFQADSGILGIVECNNHLVAYDRTTIYTSSLEVPNSFTPDLGTGAGSSIPQDLTGDIVICVPVQNGFIIFSNKEAILAKYKEPGLITFTLLDSVGGIAFPSNVSQYDTSGVVYAYTHNGLLAIEGEKVSPVFPEITEFLQQGYEEVYDAPFTVANSESIWLSESQTYPKSTDLVSMFRVAFNVGISVINSRYVYISYGNMTTGDHFTHAFVHDAVLGRMGKLKIPHIAISCPFDTPVFVAPGGRACYYGSSNFAAEAMLLIGKIGLQRDKVITLQEVELEYSIQSSGHTLTVYQTLDGKNIIDRALLTPMLTSAYYRKWNTRKSGKNVILRLDGSFHLAAMQVTLSTGGFR